MGRIAVKEVGAAKVSDKDRAEPKPPHVQEAHNLEADLLANLLRADLVPGEAQHPSCIAQVDVDVDCVVPYIG